ncbi:CvpA family protein [Thioclava sp. A2]|uniref:CvpA family protein n=1 Tax=Thioclava sp. FCG-A2 TaxID=3080562 RepID=UPI002955803D|nr:CvpA family protein [Thioclava sp. A2]MDV7269843.1 CvpA family protein [Thioclava sp. A2]
MDSFTIIDGIAAAVIIFSAILAYSRGLVREVLAIIGWIAAAVVAYKFAEVARPLIAQVPVLDRFIADSCELGTIAGFATVFAVALVVFSLLTPLFASMVQRSALGGLDQGLGFLFGALRGAVLVAIAFVVYKEIGIREGVPMVDNSRSIQVFSSLSGEMNSTMPDDAPGWVVARYEELVSTCTGPRTISAPQ